MSQFRILDLFSGAGGFSYGLDSLEEFETVLATDIDESALNTFQKNFPKTLTILGDITNSTIKNQIIKEAEKLDVNMIIGGPPCQGFSNKGKKLGLEDPRNFLFLEYLDIVNKIQPDLFIIENVKTMLTAADGYFIEEIKTRINDLGYVLNYEVLNSNHYGVPQNRERAILLAHKHQFLEFPEKNRKSRTVRDAISDLAFIESGEGESPSEYKLEPVSEYQKWARKNSEKLYNHIATNHSKLALKKLSLIPPEKGKEYLPKELLGKQKFKTTWGRLEWDKPSPTIDTRFDTPSNGKNSHPFINRAITPREAARLQSFDDSFIFLGNKTNICTQIGNAVPPLMARAIGESILDSLNSKKIVSNDYYKIYHADSYQIIEEFINSDLKVDHIITDPPYNISKKNNFSTMTSAKRQGVDFGEWDKEFDLYSWIGQYAQLLDKDGSFIIFCSYRYLSHICDVLEENNILVKDIIKWVKTNPMPRNINRRYVQDTEFAVWGVKKGAKWVFNKPDHKPYLRPEIKTSTVSGHERTVHPTQKSLELLEKLIYVHTNENQIILDPFMGSGTTGVAAVKNNRKFIGVEINTEYFDISEERLVSADASRSSNIFLTNSLN